VRLTSEPQATLARNTPRRGGRRGQIVAAYALSTWRFKRMWRLLLVTELGLIAAVLLVCTIPLFARVATLAGVEGAIRRGTDSIDFTVNASTDQPTPQLMQQVEQRMAGFRAQYLGAFGVDPTPSLEMASQEIPIVAEAGHAALAPLTLHGFNDAGFSRDVHVLQGRLPQPAPDALEIIATQPTLDSLGRHVGDQFAIGNASGGVVVRVVGVVEVSDDYHPLARFAAMQPEPLRDRNENIAEYQVMASIEALQRSGLVGNTSTSTASSKRGVGPWGLLWIYPMSLSHLSQVDLDHLGRYQLLRVLSIQELQTITGLRDPFGNSWVYDALYSYGQQVISAQVTSLMILAAALGLMLLFVGLMAKAVVDAQETTIATLRSRGASKAQIFTALALQSGAMGLVALVVGPLLAVPVTHALAGALLPQQYQYALAALPSNVLELAAHVGILAAVMVLVALGTMVGTLFRATSLNVLTQRQQTSRNGAKPLWQRLYLDLLAALLAFVGYGLFALMNQLANNLQGWAVTPTQLTLIPLALIAPLFLSVASVLLFLRLFPLLLRLGARIAERGRGAVAVLALSQLARSARPAMWMTLLLALATGFATFAPSVEATAAQRIQDVAAHQVGADFGGRLAVAPQPGMTGLTRRTAEYQAIPGVLAASLGIRTIATAVRQIPDPTAVFSNPVYTLLAVDADSYAQAALWSERNSAQPLSELMVLLRARRADAAAGDVVPAVVDDATWDLLHLSPGASFTMVVNGYRTGMMHLVVVARVARIPTINSTEDMSFGNPQGGLLVDVQSYIAALVHDTGDTSGRFTTANFAWLRTTDDPATLEQVRAATDSGPLQLRGLRASEVGLNLLTDRRSIIASLRTDPLRVTLAGALGVGAGLALALALVGALTIAVLWLRDQLTALALLRALGMAPRRIARVLLVQQGVVYVTALLLGGALGVLLTLVAVPPLINLTFTGLGFGLSNPTIGERLPIRLEWPWQTTELLLGTLGVICGLAVAVFGVVASRPALSQALRLDED